MLAGMPTSTVRNWLFGSSRCHQLFPRQFEDVDNYVTFYDLVQTIGVRAFRAKEMRIPMHKIRYAIKFAQDRYGIPYPLATSHSRIQWVGSTLAIETDDGRFVDASREHHGCYLIPQIVKELGVRITYDSKTGMAEEYQPLQRGKVKIVVNPQFNFGAPYLPSCGYTAATLAHAAQTERTVKAAAEAYGVTVAEIKAAKAFISSFQKHAA